MVFGVGGSNGAIIGSIKFKMVAGGHLGMMALTRVTLASAGLSCRTKQKEVDCFSQCELKWDCMCSDVEVISGCRIQEQYRSPYVTALLSQPVPSYGCVSRELVPTTDQQVDVLLFNETTNGVNRQHMSAAQLRQHVYLTLKQSVYYGMLFIYLRYFQVLIKRNKDKQYKNTIQ